MLFLPPMRSNRLSWSAPLSNCAACDPPVADVAHQAMIRSQERVMMTTIDVWLTAARGVKDGTIKKFYRSDGVTI
jgi:hypothetical protein